MKTKIDTIQLFSGRSDIRQFISVGISDEDREWLEEEHGLDDRDIEAVLKCARMWIQMNKLPGTIEVEVEDESDNKFKG